MAALQFPEGLAVVTQGTLNQLPVRGSKSVLPHGELLENG